MNRHTFRPLHREEGQVVVMAALMSTFLLIILAIATESGLIWMQRRNLQTAADAAALAGAQALDGTSATESAAIAAAEDYADENVSSLKANVATVQNNYTEVRSEVTKNATTLFGSWFGFGGIEIKADAVARIASQNLPGKGVVPIGVEQSDYNPGDGGLVELKDRGIDGVTSNAGLVNLIGDTGDQIRDGLKYGSSVPLTPVIDTEPGNKLGQATQNKNSGLRVRIERALTHSPRCYTWIDVQPPSDPTDPWPCNPFSATEANSIQATAVILIPVIVEDFTQLSGNKSIHVVPDGSGGETLYILAYFWVDAESTWKDPANGDWDLNPENTKGAIIGRWIEDAPTQLSVFNPGDCGDDCDIIDYDPDSIIKLVQLIE